MRPSKTSGDPHAVDKTNLVAMASSYFPTSGTHGCIPSFAIDGMPTFYSAFCGYFETDTYPWLQVDLLKDYGIHKVRVAQILL